MWRKKQKGVDACPQRILGFTRPAAVELVGTYGSTFADLNDQRLMFFPESRLPDSPLEVRGAFYACHEFCHPFDEEVTRSMAYCYAKLAWFVPDEVASVCAESFARIQSEVSPTEWLTGYLTPLLKCQLDFGLPGLRDIYGPELISSLLPTRTDKEGEFLRLVAQKCWDQMCVLIDDWALFADG